MKLSMLERNNTLLSADNRYRKDATYRDSKKSEPAHPHKRLYASKTTNDDTNQSGTITPQEAKEKLRKITEGKRNTPGDPPAKPSAGTQKNQVQGAAETTEIGTDKSTVGKLTSSDFALLDSSLRLVELLNRSLAQKHKVKIELGEVPKLTMPEHVRLYLFTIVNKLVTMAIESADASKDERYVSFSAKVGKGDIVYITVEDNGVGIEDTSAVFKEDKRLVIIRKLAEKSGLELGLSSKPGKGTTAMVIIFPFQRQEMLRPAKEILGRLKPDAQAKALYHQVKPAIEQFANLADQVFGNESEDKAARNQINRLSDTLDQTSQQDRATALFNIIPIFLEEASAKAFEQLTDSYEQWLMWDVLFRIAEEAGATLESIKTHGQQAAQAEIREGIDTLREIASTIEISMRNLGQLYKHLLSATDKMHVPNEGPIERWRTVLMNARESIHDLRNIANGVMGITEIITGQFGSDPEADGLPRKLEEVSHYKPTLLNANLNYVRDLNSPLAESHNVKVELGEIPQLTMSKDMGRIVYRLANELVTNAIKHAKARTITIGAEKVEDDIHIIVADDGVGIEDIPAALRRGVQLQPDPAEGGGLGLYNVRKLAEEAGGKFILTSTPGEGTTATVVIPTAQWEKPPPTGTGGPAASGAAPSNTGSPSGTGNAPSTPSAHGMKGVKRFADVGGFAPQNEEMYSSPGSDGTAVWMYSTAGQSGVNTMGQGVAPQWWFPSVGPASAVWFGAAQMAGARALTIAP